MTSHQRIGDGRRHAFLSMMRRVEARQETGWNKNVYMTETSRNSTRNSQVEDATFQSLRDSLEKIDRWQFVEEIEGLKRQLHEKDRQLEQNVIANANTATCTPAMTSPRFDAVNNSSTNHPSESHMTSNHVDIVNELLQLRHSHTVLQTQYDQQNVQIQNSMIDANRALDSIVRLEGHTLHGRHMCASAQCVGWLLSARQGLEAVVSTLSTDGNATPASTTAEDLQTVPLNLNQSTDPDASAVGSVEAMLTAGSEREQTMMDMCKWLERKNQALTEKMSRLEGMLTTPSLVESSAKSGRTCQQEESTKLSPVKMNDDDDACGSGE